jgi:DNA-binding NarL/FixJ family response regulator
MSLVSNSERLRIGFFTNEPIRVEGLAAVSSLPVEAGHPAMVAVTGSPEELLTDLNLKYMVVDLNSSCCTVKTPETLHRLRPDLRLIVIGTEVDDEMVIQSIMAGARAYLDASAGPEVVRKAIETVVAGSIWAPRPLLSKLIDRLIVSSDSSLCGANSQLTSRENQVLDLIRMARSNGEIALELGIEERTVKGHVGRLKRKTGADSRIELSLLAMENSPAPPAGVVERRHEIRRESDYLQSYEPEKVTYE